MTSMQAPTTGAGPSCDFSHAPGLAIGLIASFTRHPAHFTVGAWDVCRDPPCGLQGHGYFAARVKHRQEALAGLIRARKRDSNPNRSAGENKVRGEVRAGAK